MRFEEAQQLLDQYIGPTDPTDPKARRRVKILRAASELFARVGYRKTSVEEVAERAGVAKGTVYLYFQTKLELLIAAISLEKREHFEQFRPFFDDSLPAAERLRHWIRSALLMGARMPIVSRLLQGGEIIALYDELPDELIKQQEAIRLDFLGPLVAELSGHPVGSERVAMQVEMLAGLAHAAGAFLQAPLAMPIERFVDELARTVVAGLQATDDDQRGS